MDMRLGEQRTAGGAATVLLLVLGCLLLLFIMVGFVFTGVHLGWPGLGDVAFYAGLPAGEVVLVSATLSRRHLTRVVALVWCLNALNVALVFLGAFGGAF